MRTRILKGSPIQIGGYDTRHHAVALPFIIAYTRKKLTVIGIYDPYNWTLREKMYHIERMSTRWNLKQTSCSLSTYHTKSVRYRITLKCCAWQCWGVSNQVVLSFNCSARIRSIPSIGRTEVIPNQSYLKQRMAKCCFQWCNSILYQQR